MQTVLEPSRSLSVFRQIVDLTRSKGGRGRAQFRVQNGLWRGHNPEGAQSRGLNPEGGFGGGEGRGEE